MTFSVVWHQRRYFEKCHKNAFVFIQLKSMFFKYHFLCSAEELILTCNDLGHINLWQIGCELWRRAFYPFYEMKFEWSKRRYTQSRKVWLTFTLNMHFFAIGYSYWWCCASDHLLAGFYNMGKTGQLRPLQFMDSLAYCETRQNF